MLVVGLTGSIATGKSFVSTYINKHFGYPVFNADLEVHKLLETNVKLKKSIQNKFNLQQNNQIDRAELAKIAFSSQTNLKKLERIIFPEIKQLAWRFIEKHKQFDVIILEAPLLFEANMHKMCSIIITTFSHFHRQQKRASMRLNYNEQHFAFVNKRQISSYKKKYISHFTISTNYSKMRTQKQIIQIFQGIISERNCSRY